MNVRDNPELFPYFAQSILAAAQITPQGHGDHILGERFPVLRQTINSQPSLPIRMLLNNVKLLFLFHLPTLDSP